MIRAPAVAGMFYPGEKRELARALAELIVPSPAPVRAAMLIAPHAGYVYSGRVAGAVYGAVQVPDEALILAFNHHGVGPELALWPSGEWATPLGRAPISATLVEALRRGVPGVELDESSHVGEHSAEVQVPFLQARNPNVRIAVLALNAGIDDPSVGRLRETGRALARAVPRETLVVVSTDLNHYEPDDLTRQKDARALEAMERMDAAALAREVRERDLRMCGYAPSIAGLEYVKARGCAKGRRVAYATSADAGAGKEQVVGYPGVIFEWPG